MPVKPGAWIHFFSFRVSAGLSSLAKAEVKPTDLPQDKPTETEDPDRVVSPDAIEAELEKTIAALRAIHRPSHASAKKRLRQATMDAMRAAIDRELTMAAYEASNRARAAVVLPG